MLSIVQLVALANLVLFATANPLVAHRAPPRRAQCSEASCYKALQPSNAKSDCKSYQEATTTLCPKTTTMTVSQCTSTITTTKAHDSGLNAPRALVEDRSPLHDTSLRFLVKKSNQAQCPNLFKPSNIPTYAKSACDSSEYASACSCLGYPATTTTLSPTSTVTLQHCMTTTKTISPSCTSASTTVTYTGTTTATITSTTTVSIGYTVIAVSTESATITSTSTRTAIGPPATASTVTVTTTATTITKTTTLDTTVNTTRRTATTLTAVSTNTKTASTPAITTSTTYTLAVASTTATVTTISAAQEFVVDRVVIAEVSGCSTHTVSVTVMRTVTSTSQAAIYVFTAATSTVPTTTTVSTRILTSTTTTFPTTTTPRTTVTAVATVTKTLTNTITGTIINDISTTTAHATTTITTRTSTKTAVATETVKCASGDYCYPLIPGSSTSEITVAECGVQASNSVFVKNITSNVYQDCIKACAATGDCYVFSYQISSSACVMYGDSTYNPVPNSDYVSGYYDGPNGCEVSST